MLTILVTGAAGFIGQHLVEALGRRPDVRVICYDIGNTRADLNHGLAEADFIFHLAGVNRPQRPEEFKTGNADFTASICDTLSVLERNPTIVLSSSIQAELQNPYGLSKRQAEEALMRWAEGRKTAVSARWSTDHRRAVIFRLKNVFGKWCRPNYNSVTATFCHNTAHDLPIMISDPSHELELVYIDDVITAFVGLLTQRPTAGACARLEVEKSYRISLGDLAARIRSFKESRRSLLLPDMADELTRKLYVTYLSYLDGPEFAYSLDQKVDSRGSLAEFLKSPAGGQIFVSRTKPGVTRGNHYHHSKTEKFLVVEGNAVIRFRHINGSEIIEHRVSGQDFKVVDIPPGYAHSIENAGSGEMVCLFWSSELFDQQKPDTYYVPVLTT
ncbi:MAG: NAD-dependent epimerase/dehydratase family protein [Verrucomicrobiota bacterium]|jgi:UDP-2-acetamido-2,6-beta-L-arabino-hexul-4-ose reductase